MAFSTIPGEENASSGTIKKSEDILVSTARLSESFASKGHRKTNSLDRPVKPPPAPPTFNDSSRTANEAISTLPEEPSSTGTDSISKGSSHPVRPPLPTKENLERNSVMRNSIGKGESSKDAETTSDEPQKAARHQGRKAPKADISEADSSENLYDEVMPDIPENASPPKNRLDSHTKGAEVVTRRSATDELREGEEVVKDRVKTRLSMFEGPRNGGAQVPMSFKASSSSTADKESLSPTFPVPHILTVNNDSSGAPPPRPKPPVPNKPKVEGVADSDMTRL